MNTSNILSVRYMALIYVVRNQIMSLFFKCEVVSCLFIFLENELLFGGSNDQFMGLIFAFFSFIP